MKSRFVHRACVEDTAHKHRGTGHGRGQIAQTRLGQRLRSRVFDLVWALWTMLFGPAIPLLLVMGAPARVVRIFTRIWARGMLIELAWIVGLTFREEGRNHIPDAPCLIICNHQSIWETVAALVLFPDVAIVAKQELLGIPILSWFLRRSPMIIIDRDGAGRTLRKMVDQSISALAAGRSVLIFPEGTRKRANEVVMFKRGVALLYKALGVSVLPMVLNSGRFWGVNKNAKGSGIITISYLATIEPGLEPSEFASLCERLMQAEKERLYGE